MSYELINAVYNDVLCFLTTQRNSYKNNEIQTIAVAFYSHDAIKEAKEKIYSICQPKEKMKFRKVSKGYPNPASHDVQDILDLIVKMEGKNFLLPDFYAKSLPPQIGFLEIARMMCILGAKN